MTRLLHYPELRSAAQARRPRIVLVLGSGLSDVADRLTDVVELPFGCLPGLEEPGVPGHRGALLLGTWADVPVVVFAGRLHYYEGHPWRRVVQPIHIAHELGASILIATNAAGGIRPDLKPGDLLAIRGHLDWTRPQRYQPEAPARKDSSLLALRAGDSRESPYSRRLLEILRRIDPNLPTGVYAQLMGPCYETPAEIRALSLCGADVAGMSTAREIEAGRELGLECAAISCITNLAAGLGAGPIDHAEVLEMGRQVNGRLVRLLEKFMASL